MHTYMHMYVLHSIDQKFRVTVSRMWDKSYQYIKNTDKSLYTGHKLIMSNFVNADLDWAFLLFRLVWVFKVNCWIFWCRHTVYFRRCVLSDFCREVDENCVLLGYYSGNFLLMFWVHVFCISSLFRTPEGIS